MSNIIGQISSVVERQSADSEVRVQFTMQKIAIFFIKVILANI
jgi:hypothetical protein